jgi:hypothetical protein
MWTWVPRWGVCNSNYLGDGPTRSIGLPGTLKALRASGPCPPRRPRTPKTPKGPYQGCATPTDHWPFRQSFPFCPLMGGVTGTWRSMGTRSGQAIDDGHCANLVRAKVAQDVGPKAHLRQLLGKRPD